MMKSMNRAVFGLVLLTPLGGCLDLEEEIVSGVTSSYYEDAAGLEDAVRATYATLRTFYGTQNGAMLSEGGTDLYGVAQGGNTWMHLYSASLNPSQPLFKSVWDDFYRSINTANAIIGRAPETRMSEALKTQRIAEARFLRAFYYFHLVQMFGDVYLSLEETAGVKTETPRTPKAEVFNAIVADLEFAAATLPPVQSEYGRATRGAAQHYLAKVYLTRAGPGDLARAADAARRVIDSGQYQMLPSYESIFVPGNERNREVVFAVRYGSDPLSNGEGNQWHMPWLMTYSQIQGLQRSLEYGRHFQQHRPTTFLLRLFDRARDSRYETSFQRVWYANDATTIPKDASGKPKFALGDTALFLPEVEVPNSVIQSTRYQITPPSRYSARLFPGLRKHMDPNRESINETRGIRDVMVARLAETYLLAAEALIRDGRPAEAVPFVNAVRRRAALPGRAAEMEVTAAQMTLDFLLDERARELAGEGHRWFDLVRTGKLVERVKAHNPSSSAIQPFHVLRPIPQTAIDRTTTPFPQNPGY